MTREEVIEATAEGVSAAEALSAHLERMTVRMAEVFPLRAEIIEGWEDAPREQLHAVLRIFEQLYDLSSRKLLRGLLFLSGEPLADMSMQNQFRRAESLGAIENADRWIALAGTRNMLVYDYPSDPAAQSQRANRAWSDMPGLIADTRAIITYLRAGKLI